MKLTKEMIEARMVVYDEVCDHLEMAICDGLADNLQATIVKTKIRSMAYKWYAIAMKRLQERNEK